jgi:hypothetical protein
MTTWPSQIPSFPGLTGESRKKLDARLRPAGMTRKQEWIFKMCLFNSETLNKCRVIPVEICPGSATVAAMGFDAGPTRKEKKGKICSRADESFRKE